MPERRKHPRYGKSVPVVGSLIDSAGQPRGLSADTLNVSREGLAIALHGKQGTVRSLASLLSETQSLEIEIKLAPLGPRVRATGNVQWHDMRSMQGSRHYLVAGIFLRHMEPDDRTHWEHFIGDVARNATAEAARA
jgi:hypothetical protein